MAERSTSRSAAPRLSRAQTLSSAGTLALALGLAALAFFAATLRPGAAGERGRRTAQADEETPRPEGPVLVSRER